MGGYGIFVLVVDFDLKKPLDLLGGPHLDGVPGHSFANVHANLATDTFIEPDLHVRDHNIDAVGSIAGRQFDQASQPVQLSGITTAISLGFFFFLVIFAGASGMISVGFAFLGSYATCWYTPNKVYKSILPRRLTIRSRVSPIWLFGVAFPDIQNSGSMSDP